MNVKPQVRGEGLLAIIKRFNAEHGANVTLADIARLNPAIADLDKIQFGQDIAFPDVYAKATASAALPALTTPDAPSGAGAVSIDPKKYPHTSAVLQQVLAGLSDPAERAMVTDKAVELLCAGYTVEEPGTAPYPTKATAAERYAANLAGELSEHLATGAGSAELLQSFKGLMGRTGPVMKDHPSLQRDIDENLRRGEVLKQLKASELQAGRLGRING